MPVIPLQVHITFCAQAEVNADGPSQNKFFESVGLPAVCCGPGGREPPPAKFHLTCFSLVFVYKSGMYFEPPLSSRDIVVFVWLCPRRHVEEFVAYQNQSTQHSFVIHSFLTHFICNS